MSHGHALRLDGELTIYRAAELKTALLLALGRAADTLVLDLSGVSEIDSAGLQLLLLLRAESAAAGRRLQLAAPSEAVQELVALLDVAPLFEFTEAAPLGV